VNVIGVGVGKENGVKAHEACPHGLKAEFGPRINDGRSPPVPSTKMDARMRLSRPARERQTLHRHPTTGMPWEVPDPRMVIFIP
jgi:hypothetical protein